MAKKIVLTGGATGIGAATVKKLLVKGCDITVLDLVAPKSQEIKFVQCDLSKVASINHAITALPKNFDSLINVAGVSNALPGETIMAVNFLGLRHLTNTLINNINDGGNIVNVASSAAFDWKDRQDVILQLLKTPSFESGLAWLQENTPVWIDNPYKFSKQCTAAYNYQATGFAINRGIRVNCVNPGSTGTQLTADFRKLVGEAMYDWGVQKIGREGQPEDIAEVIEFLSIGSSTWINGVEITADGGFIAGLIGGWLDLENSPNSKNKGN